VRGQLQLDAVAGDILQAHDHGQGIAEAPLAVDVVLDACTNRAGSKAEAAHGLRSGADDALAAR